MDLSLNTLGIVAYPLLICSIFGFTIVMERVIFILMWRSGKGYAQEMLSALSKDNTNTNAIPHNKSKLASGTRLLLKHSKSSHTMREEVINHWVSLQQTKLFSRLGWLTLIAVVSPMLGLLGTVLGMIKVFASIAAQTGPVSPSLLANGLSQAMNTTAAGLIVALPILVAIHSFRIWGNGQVVKLSQTLNVANLLIEGVDPREVSFSKSGSHNSDVEKQAL